MMPLFHVGGIIRNLLAVSIFLLSSTFEFTLKNFMIAHVLWRQHNNVLRFRCYGVLGSCPKAPCHVVRPVNLIFVSADANLYYIRYYAAPTIHHAILSSQPENLVPSEHLAIRLICNAAGGLLPSLAIDLKSTFKAIILPSYGMTE